ncbi:MAG: Rpn family recombination-promoting nuclease/putative transposase [Microcystaceae cyanobacterium]
MKTDKIFYTLFQLFPDLLFQLIGESTEMAQYYEFKSIEVKELDFRLDRIFFPDENRPDDPIYFVEVQFQKDPDFYWRLITEMFLYLRQYKPLRPCYAVVMWGNEKLDEGLPLPYQGLVVTERIQRIYLDKIDPSIHRSLGIGIIEFIEASPSEATQRFPLLVNQTRKEFSDPIFQDKLLGFIAKVIVYKFPLMEFKEIETMFDLIDFKETQFYKDVEREVEQRMRKKLKIEGKLETIPSFLRLGLTSEQIAQELGLDVEVVNQYIADHR